MEVSGRRKRHVAYTIKPDAPEHLQRHGSVHRAIRGIGSGRWFGYVGSVLLYGSVRLACEIL